MPNQYRRYSRRVINKTEARAVLRFVFGGSMPSEITELHRRFAQFLLVELLDKSIAMGFVQSLFESSMEPGATVTGICKKLIKDQSHLLYGWFTRSSHSDVMEAASDINIYRSVRDQLKRNFRSEWTLMRHSI